MRLVYVEVENFLSHRKEQLALPEEGFFFLDGPSGWGKSSLICDAPAYALFGPKATRAKQEELRHIDYPEDPMRVRVDFKFSDGSVLGVERGLDERNSPYAFAVDGNGVELARGAAPVERYVRQRLGGLSWRQFYSAFVARQDEIDALTKKTGSERRDLVHALLGVRELELAQKEAMERRKRARVELERLIERVGERTQQSQAELVSQSQAAVRAAELQLAETEKKLADTTAELERAAEEIAPLLAAQEKQASILRIENGLRVRLAEISAVRERVARHEQAAADLAQAGSVDEELARTTAEKDQTLAAGQRAAKITDLREKQAASRERLNEARIAAGVREPVGGGVAVEDAPAPAPADESSDRMQGRLETIASERERIRGERAKRAHELDELNGSGACFTCLRPLPPGEERDRVLAEVEGFIAELEKALTDLEHEESEIQRKLPEATRREVELGRAQRELAKAEEALHTIERDLTKLLADGEVDGDADDLRARYKQLNDREQELRGEKGRVDAIKANLDPGAATRLAALETEQAGDEQLLRAAREAAGDFEQATLERLQSTERGLRERVAGLKSEIPLLEQALKTAKDTLRHTEAEAEAFALLLEEREQKAKLVQRLEDLVAYIDRFAHHLAGEIRPALEEMSSEMLVQISDGRHISLSLDENYDIAVQRAEGNWLKASSLSGGERIRANIALRVALMRLVSHRTGVPVQFLVLDEPLPSQDAGHVQRIMELLDSLSSFYPQRFVISHVGATETLAHADYKIRFVSPDDENRVVLEYA